MIGLTWIATVSLLIFTTQYFSIRQQSYISSSSSQEEQSYRPSHPYDRLVIVLIVRQRVSRLSSHTSTHTIHRTHFDTILCFLYLCKVSRLSHKLSETNNNNNNNNNNNRYQTHHLYLARATTPTVTLPRLKALTRGVPPTFSDLLFNFRTFYQSQAFSPVTKRTHTYYVQILRLPLRHESRYHFIFQIIQELESYSFLVMIRGKSCILRTRFWIVLTLPRVFSPDITEVDTNVSRHIDTTFDPTLKHPHST